MSWEKEVLEIERRRHLAKQQGGKEGIAKQHARGRLTIRERIDVLLDTPRGRPSPHDVGDIAHVEDFVHQGYRDGEGQPRDGSRKNPRQITAYQKRTDRRTDQRHRNLQRGKIVDDYRHQGLSSSIISSSSIVP